jgi:RNA-directed DNA polymerase
MTQDLSKRLRSRFVLHGSWKVVKASGYSSGSPETQKKTKNFEENWLNNLDRLRRQLKDGTFKFSNEIGVTPPKARGKPGIRPLVVAPVENRIVRRAILDILQGYGHSSPNPRNRWTGIQAVRNILETPTSVGGIPSRGVPHGLSLIDTAVRSGHHWFIRSDIRDFFTRIPLGQVNRFIQTSVQDQLFCDLFGQALSTNLSNREELEERNHFILFPNAEIGVAQGSALSALAGNIVLQDFDTAMNGRGVVCVRYIDDFILLGKTEAKVAAAFKSATALLSKLGMTAYDVSDNMARKAGKVDTGNIHNGTDVLGYRISARSLQPSAAAQQALLTKLDDIIKLAKTAMRQAAAGKIQSHAYQYHHAMEMIHKTIWGWSQAFKYVNVPHVLQSLDLQIDDRIFELQRLARHFANGASPLTKRRVTGIHLVQDTYAIPLPEVNPSTTAITMIA